jgi:hypothetical protein
MEKLLRQSDDEMVMPYYYYTPKHLLELERANPGSQEKWPSSEIKFNSTHLWTQAIWFICQLMSITIMINF